MSGDHDGIVELQDPCRQRMSSWDSSSEHGARKQAQNCWRSRCDALPDFCKFDVPGRSLGKSHFLSAGEGNEEDLGTMKNELLARLGCIVPGPFL